MNLGIRLCLALLLFAEVVCAQRSLRLKTRTIHTENKEGDDSGTESRDGGRRGAGMGRGAGLGGGAGVSVGMSRIRQRRTFSRFGKSATHVLLQFREAPTADVINEIKASGIAVLGDVPENGLLVSIPSWRELPDLDLQYTETILPVDKISPLISSGDPASWSGYFLIEFHADTDMNAARGTLLNLGITMHDSPDLSANHLMIHADEEERAQLLATLAAQEDVAYVFPASKELAEGIPVKACNGAYTLNGAVSQVVPVFGEGWDGPGLNPVTLTVVWGAMTSKLDPVAAKAEIQRAMADWSKVVAINWQAGTNGSGLKTVHIKWALADHGDGFPFDKAGGVLAHTFYPAPPNPEPIAGDFHLDEAESWKIGANMDLYSVALHELGHALGLGHADDPSSIMYPYYKMVSGLSAVDKTAILSLYAPASANPNPNPVNPTVPETTPANPVPKSTPAPAPTPTPLNLTVSPVATPTTSSAVNLRGSAAGGTGAITVSWSTNTGQSGVATGSAAAWTASAIPLAVGNNVITINAVAGTSRAVTLITVARTAITTGGSGGSGSSGSSGSSGRDVTAPTLAIGVPSTGTAATSSATYTVSGTASDNVGVKTITWSTTFGQSGTASGTTSWSASFGLLKGVNTFTVRAYDAAGNSSSRTAQITRR